MRIEDVTKDSAAALPLCDLLDIKHRAEQIFSASEQWRKSTQANVAKGIDRAKLVEAYGHVAQQLAKRGQTWPKTELDHKLVRKALRGLDVAELPPIVLRPAAVSVAGTFAGNPKGAWDIDVRVDSDEFGDEISYAIEAQISKLLLDKVGLPITCRRNDKGLQGPVLPLYDVMLVPRSETKDLDAAGMEDLRKRLGVRKDADFEAKHPRGEGGKFGDGGGGKVEYRMATGREQDASLLDWHPESQELVKMSPDRFLELAAKGGVAFEKTGMYSKDKVDKLKERMAAGKPLDALFLDVAAASEKVVEHEGRHRATAAKQLGIKEVPVIVYHRGEEGRGYLDAKDHPGLGEGLRDGIKKADDSPIALTTLTDPITVEQAPAADFDDTEPGDTELAPGVGVIWGSKLGKVKPQSLTFDPLKFTPEQAAEFCRERGMKDSVAVAKRESLLKVDEEERIVGGVVYNLGSPAKADGQGDFVDDIGELWKALKDWQIRSNGTVKVMHSGKAVPVKVIECFLAECDLMKGGRRLKTGDWFLSCWIPPEEESLWQDIKQQKVTGFSLAGSAKVEVV